MNKIDLDNWKQIKSHLDGIVVPEDFFKTLIVEDETDGQIRLQMEFNYDRNEETEKDIRLEEDC